MIDSHLVLQVATILLLIRLSFHPHLEILWILSVCPFPILEIKIGTECSKTRGVTSCHVVFQNKRNQMTFVNNSPQILH